MTHILLTRPLEASQQLALQLKAQGLKPVVMPLYTFAARQPESLANSGLSQTSGRKLAVFTSPRAVQYGLPHLPDHLPNELEFVVVGSATGKQLESAGFAVHLQAQTGFTSEDLLQVRELASDPGTAVIFCAPDGRQALAEGLAAMGWCVIRAMVYERVIKKPEPDHIRALLGAGDLLSVWTSISAIKIAQEFLPLSVWEKILQAPALVISVRIQHYLQRTGAKNVELSDGPGNPALLNSIQRLVGTRIAG